MERAENDLVFRDVGQFRQVEQGASPLKAQIIPQRSAAG
jgi:hypothetical protein